MAVWYLFFWSSYVSIFEGGQYQTKLACETAAVVQQTHYRKEGYGRLEHVCELKVGI